MAAPSYSSVGGRSVQSSYNSGPVQRTAVADDEFLNRLMQQLQESFSGASGNTAAVTPASEAISRSSYVADSNFSQSGSQLSPQELRAALSGMSSLGLLFNSPELSQMAGIGQLGYNLATAKTPGDLAAAVAPTIANIAGLPGPAIGFGVNALRGNTAGMIDSAIGMANPAAGAANSILGSLTTMFGDRGVSAGTIATQSGFGKDVFGDVGLIDATQGALDLNYPRTANPNPDTLGALTAITGGQDSSYNLSTDAATIAANAMASANNIDSMDALMSLTGAYGTADTVGTDGTDTGTPAANTAASAATQETSTPAKSSSYNYSSNNYNSNNYYSSNGGSWSSVW